MAGECEQNNNFWCPLKNDDCAKGKLSKPCVLLYSASHALFQLAQIGVTCKIEKGTMTFKKRNDKPWLP